MNKRIIGLFLVILIIASIFSGCGGTRADKSTMGNGAVSVGQAEAYNTDNKAMAEETNVAAEREALAPDAGTNTGDKVDSIGGGGNAVQNVSNAILSERKVIRSANVTLEVENFDEAYAKLDTMILGIGYIQSTNINSERYYYNDNKQKLLRSGTIIIRVDREKFDKVLNSIKGIGEVFNWTINGEDVTDKYFDTESRLRLLRIEESKLEEYLKKLNDLDQIFKTESRLTEIRYQIEALTGNLKKMSDLVDLSTISISMNEKRPDWEAPIKPKTYAQKLLDNFLESMKGVIGFVGDLVIILVAAIPVLVLLGVFVFLGILIYRKIPRKRQAKTFLAEPSEKKDKDNNN